MDFIHTSRENRKQQDFKDTLPKIVSVAKTLRSENLNFSDAGAVFAKTLKYYKENDFKQYFSMGGHNVHMPMPVFETDKKKPESRC